MTTETALLAVSDLRVRYARSAAPALVTLSFSVGRAERVALIGRSGSGKSTVGRALLGLLPASAEVSGQMRLAEQRLDQLGEKEWRWVRGGRIALVGQESQSALNPVRKIQAQFKDVLRRHHPALPAEGVHQSALRWLSRVGLESEVMRLYPHQLSGGMRQRALLAMTLSCQPKLLIADEPTSGQDRANQQRTLGLLDQLCREFNTALLLITHDLSLVDACCSRVLVMSHGRLVESAPVDQLLKQPAQPATKALARAVRRLEAGR